MRVKLGVVTWCYLLLMLINHSRDSYYVSAKSLDVTQQNCHEHVGEFFKSFLNISIVPSEKLGDICGGHCCSSQTEADVLKKSVKTFEGLIRHQIKSLKGLWEATHNIYKDHVLDLSRQSENKTLILFSTVYRRMSPLSRTPILELYKSIRSYITSQKPLTHEVNSSSSNNYNYNELEAVIERFFRNLFPLAYHHAVHSDGNEESSQGAARDFHADYKNCLINSYETLHPFGEIPYSISRSLVQSATSASTLLRALERGAEVLNEIENLPFETSLSGKCQHALLKMNYCAACKGHNYHHLKPCYGYCSNVKRGCLTQLMGGIDKDWASFSEAIERLMTFVRNKDGIESVIKNLDGKLSEAIMHAMTNGPDLQKKVHKSCGRLNEKLAQQEHASSDIDGKEGPSLEGRQVKSNGSVNGGSGSKWSPPPDTEMLQFLSVLDRSKSFSLQIANSYCEDDRYQKQDRNCWNGESLGDYTHKIMDMHSQKYNPEVPVEEGAPSDSGLHKINDQLITMKNIVNKQMAHLSKPESDQMLSDMAENGSADYENRADYDDEDYDDLSGSGDHSPRGPQINPEPSNPVTVPKLQNPNAGGSLRISVSTLFVVLLPSYVVILFKF